MTTLAVGLSVYLFVAVVVLAELRADYRHERDTISELGEHGAPRAVLTGLGVFLPVGLGLWSLAWLVRDLDAALALLATSLGVGYVVGGLFPCDQGLPRNGSWRQKVHNAGGLAEYLGSAYALYVLAPAQGSLSALFYATALFAPLSTLTTVITPLRPVRGIVQRIAECLLFALMVWAVGQAGG